MSVTDSTLHKFVFTRTSLFNTFFNQPVTCSFFTSLYNSNYYKTQIFYTLSYTLILFFYVTSLFTNSHLVVYSIHKLFCPAPIMLVALMQLILFCDGSRIIQNAVTTLVVQPFIFPHWSAFLSSSPRYSDRLVATPLFVNN